MITIPTLFFYVMVGCLVISGLCHVVQLVVYYRSQVKDSWDMEQEKACRAEAVMEQEGQK